MLKNSLALRVIVICFLLLALPLVVDSIILFQQGYENSLNDAKQYLVEYTNDREIALSEVQPVRAATLSEIEFILKLNTQFPEGPDPKMSDTLERLASAGHFSAMQLIKITPDKKFILVSSTDQTVALGKDYTDVFALKDIFSSNVYHKGYFDFFSYNEFTYIPYLNVGRVVYSKERIPIGLILVSIDMRDSLKTILNPETYPYTVNYAILYQDKVVYASTDPAIEYQYFSPLDAKTRESILKESKLAKHLLPRQPIEVNDTLGFPFIEFTWKNTVYLGVLRFVSSMDMYLMAYAKKNEVYSIPWKSFLIDYGGYAIILIIGGVLAYLITLRFTRPFKQLANTMSAVKTGDLAVRYHSDPLGFEINNLGSIFNETLNSLLEKMHLAEEEKVKKEKLAQELSIGHQVQLSLFPKKIPDLPFVEIAETYIPAKEVGGDFYDVFIKPVKRDPDKKELALVIADASGKGVSACLYSLIIRSLIRTFSLEEDSLYKIVNQANDLFCLDTGDTGMFVTLLMGVYDYETSSFRYFCAGHNPGIIRRKDGNCELLKLMGPALGVVPLKPIEENVLRLYPGDMVIFYTDGVTESHNTEQELFSEERLLDIVSKNAFATPEECIKRIINEIKHFSKSAPQHDDITILALKVKDD